MDFSDLGGQQVPDAPRKADFSDLGGEQLTVPPTLAERASKIVRNVAQDTAETFRPPVTVSEAQREMEPRVGRAGVGRSLQEAGETVHKAVNAVSPLAGAVLPPLTPESAAEQIGSEAMLHGASLIPGVAAIGRNVGKLGEHLSGMSFKAPGRLAEIADQPSKLFAPGTSATSEQFGQALKSLGKDSDLAGIRTTEGRLDAAANAVERGEPLSGIDAFKARRSIDKIIGKGSTKFDDEWLGELRDKMDTVVKASSEMREADAAYTDAVKADISRSVLPVNRRGDVSLGRAVFGLGGHRAFLSPLVNSAAAAGVGVARKVAPAAVAAFNAGSENDLPEPDASPFGQTLAAAIAAARKKVLK